MPLLLSRKDAAKELSVCPRTVDKLITLGYFKPTRIGARVQIPFSQIQKFATGDHPVLKKQSTEQ
jgi:Helix-turn-helix domain